MGKKTPCPIRNDTGYEIKCIDLDELARKHGASNRKHADWLIEIKENMGGEKRHVASIVIEDTGHPEIRDLEKLEETTMILRKLEKTRYREPIKILHHKGKVWPPMNKLAAKKMIIIVRCSSGLKLSNILEKAGLPA